MRAPGFPSGSWFNCDGNDPLTLAHLRGKPVVLDFFTAGCANCLHVLAELRCLEEQFGDQITVIGIHSPKFDYEESDSAVAALVQRQGLRHPVFNDADRFLWQQYAIGAWPTLVLLDQTGYVVAQAVGEGHVTALAGIVADLLAEQPKLAERTIVAVGRPLRLGAGQAQADILGSGPDTAAGLSFPAKAILVDDELVIADAGAHQVVVCDRTGSVVRRRIGNGTRGNSATELSEPNGLAILPPAVAAGLGYDLIVADTGNHVLRGVRLADGSIRARIDLTAGLSSARTITGAIPAVLSPWDVAWWPAAGKVVVAAAGVHLLLGWDPVAGTTEVLAGTTVEGLKDGPALQGWLAQPSGLAVEGDRVWFVDAETSALRWLDGRGELHTAIGEGLFDFGFQDGPAATARLQHPLGLALLPDHSIAIADTYNGAVRRYDPGAQTLSTLATGLLEPSGLVLADDEILVVESAAHRITSIAIADALDREPPAQHPSAQNT